MSLKFADNSIKVDSIVTLGSWPQKKDGSVQPIEWQVLEVKDDHALLLSKYVLELRPYHNANAGIPWDQCELRTWLNNEFLSKAFNKEAFSFLYTPEASDEPKDRVFLLGYKDIERFFPRDGIMFKGSAAEPTQYVQECWRQEDAIDDSSGNVIWWLRSTVPALSMANIVSPVNSVGLSLISPDNRNGVRPAIRIRLNQKRGFISRLFRRKSGHKTESRSEYNSSVEKQCVSSFQFEPGIPERAKAEFKRLAAEAEGGDAKAQEALGLCFFHGKMVQQDYEQAFKWTKKAAEAGSPTAQFDIADQYLNGMGVEADKDQAFLWMKKAAHQGYANAEANLGQWYVKGTVMEQDVEEGERLLRAAALKGDYNKEYAWYCLGRSLITHSDRGDKQEGLEWLTKAAEAGYDPAVEQLCLIYELGMEEMEDFRDKDKALKWIEKGTANGNPVCELLQKCHGKADNSKEMMFVRRMINMSRMLSKVKEGL